MPPEKFIEICYLYLKNGKWKQRTKRIKEEELSTYEKNFRILNKKEVLG